LVPTIDLCAVKRDEIDIYLQNTLQLTRGVYSHHEKQPIQDDDERISSCYRIYETMKFLYEKHVSHYKQ